MNIYESGEDYLEAILMLEQRLGSVRSIDIATELGYSKPTISIAMRRLRENGYVESDEKRELHLTPKGLEIAEKIYERHVLLSSLLRDLGVDSKTATHEACKMEHDLSADTFNRIREMYNSYKERGTFMPETMIEGLCNRRSIRKYKDEQIPDDKLNEVLRAGTYAPTAMNRQSPLIVVTQKPEDIATLSRLNAGIMGVNRDPFYGAPTVVTVFADSENPCGVQDASLVMGNLLNAAYAVGLGSCWINRAKEVFETQEGQELKSRWGIEPKWQGVGHCILGIADESPEAKPRKENYILKIE